MDEHPQWLHPGHQHLDPHVELEPVDELRLVHVALHYARMGRRELHVARQEYSFSLGSCLRLNDHCDFLASAGFVRQLLAELPVVAGEQPRLRLEVVLVRHDLLHGNDVARQLVLARQETHLGNVVYFLERLEDGEKLFRDGGVVPDDVLVLQLLEEVFVGDFAHVVAVVVAPGLCPRDAHIEGVVLADLPQYDPLGVTQVDQGLLVLARLLVELQIRFHLFLLSRRFDGIQITGYAFALVYGIGYFFDTRTQVFSIF